MKMRVNVVGNNTILSKPTGRHLFARRHKDYLQYILEGGIRPFRLDLLHNNSAKTTPGSRADAKSPMMDDFVNAIAYEVKLEIANRYFGFRSQIQAEIGQYLEGLHRTEKEHLPLIRLDIRRMGILLHRQAFLEQFLRMTGLSERIAENGFDRQSLSNADELFTGLAGEGFSRWRRYRDLAFKVYRSLQNHIGAYRNARLDLDDEYGEICTRIDNFHRNNDLSGILSFLRTFDSSDNERLKFLHSDSSLQDRSIDQDLRIPHPRQVSDALPDLAELPPLNQVKNPLNDLLKSAYSLHNGRDTAFPW